MISPTPLVRHAGRFGVLALTLLACGCASYAPLPLDSHAAPAARLPSLPQAQRGPAPQLSMDDIVALAILNNPDLRAARSQHGIADAQVIEAGIAPNPSINAAYGFLLGGPGSIAALAGGVSQDVKGLVTLSYRKAAAQQAAQQLDAQILWQEWQTMAKARQLTVSLIAGAARVQLLDAEVHRSADLARRNRNALQRGDTTLSALIVDLGTAAAAHQQWADAERRQVAALHDLHALLDVHDGVPLDLPTALPPFALNQAAVAQALDNLAQRRPDLIALQLGYQSQETRVRSAILAQFPLLSLGVSGGHDNSDVRYAGPQMTLELPIFNRNQGTIAIERATRQQLHDEFTARLIGARSEVSALLADQQLLEDQLEEKRERQATLAEAAERATRAHLAHDLDERSYSDALRTRDAAALELLDLSEAILQQQLAIGSLAAVGIPVTDRQTLQVRP
jgi:outer membrane protein TolC